MQRPSSETRLTVTFQYSHGYHESGNISSVDICTADDFAETYQQLCQDKKHLLDPKRPCFPAPSYKIKLSGELNGAPVDKTFASLNSYHAYLIRNKLLPDLVMSLSK